MPPMIWVMLDESCPQGTHEFADSVNNGPWGAAFTTEFLPYLESKYRMDARPTGRLLNGHSSGGWATLQLQINYPKIFGGTWSTSPDPSDFHDFTNADLYAPNANLYRTPDGALIPIMRDHGKVVATLQQLPSSNRSSDPTADNWPPSSGSFPRSRLRRPTADVQPRHRRRRSSRRLPTGTITTISPTSSKPTGPHSNPT